MSEAHENIRRKVEIKLNASPLDEDTKEEIKSGVEETITESLDAEKRGIKVDWTKILAELFAIIESYIATANTVPGPVPTPPIDPPVPPAKSGKAKAPKDNF